MGMTTGSVGGKRGRRRPMSEINVTPLVDVMLVLLVIFMITAPAMMTKNEGVDVDLPKARGTQGSGRTGQPLAVTVDASGRVYFDGKKIEPGDVERELPKLLKGHEKEVLTIKGHKSSMWGSNVSVMAAARAAGINNFVIATESGH